MLKGKYLLAYVAGIIDGEGCIHLMRTKSGQYSIKVVVVNTNEWLINWFHLQFGGSVSIHRQYSQKAKPAYQWVITTAKCNEFLNLIYPYLLLKKPQAELAMAFQRNRQPQYKHKKKSNESRTLDEAQYILMKSYNKRGIVI